MKKKQKHMISSPIPKPSSSYHTTNAISSLMVSILLFLLLQPISSSSKLIPPPLPILPIPSSSQLQWQLGNMALFLHFGPNTFTGSEWGTGDTDPFLFNPTNLNASQWVQVAKDAGFSRLILTAKHHDGFCLWPSDYTDYSVKSSPWRNGEGDIVGELAKAAKDAGIQLGIYLSPWDRHEPRFGNTLDYNEFYIGQMTELLTRYGDIKEVFLDGAKGEGEKDMEYFFDSWFSIIHQLQPGAVIFSDAGPGCRWIGNEAGVAKSTCWSLFNSSAVTIGGENDPQYAGEGDPFGHDWLPAECDVSIRPNWFWRASDVPKSGSTLLDIYYKSVGRNCLFLLNVPPNSSGLISAEDIQVLQEFTKLQNSIFSLNLAASALLHASSTRGDGKDARFSPINILKEGIYSYWAPAENQSDWVLYLDLQDLVSFNVLHIQEPIHMGQRVIEFHFDILSDDGIWKTVVNGTTVGYRRLLLFPTIESRFLRLVIEKSRAVPLISYLGIHVDKFSNLSTTLDTRLAANVNGSEVLRQVTFNHSQSAAV